MNQNELKPIDKPLEKNFKKDFEVFCKQLFETNDVIDLVSLGTEDIFETQNVDEIFGTQLDIYELLKDSLIHRNYFMEEVENKTNKMDKAIGYYKSFILEDKDAETPKRKNKKFYITEKSDDETEIEKLNEIERDLNDELIEPSDLNQKPVSNTALSKQLKNEEESVKKTIDVLEFLGFNEQDFTELPDSLEAPQILHNLSQKMGFKKTFLKYWTPIIRSEASCAIILDSFWWFYLKYFRKDPTFDIDVYKYFCRLSDSFVALFLSVDSSIRDRFFGYFADFLCQAVYLTFYRGFPDCRFQFDDIFKQEICDTIFEWILGVKPIPEMYKEWKINSEIVFNGIAEVKISSNNDIYQKISNLEKLLNNLGDQDKESKATLSVKFADTSRVNSAFRKEITSKPIDENKNLLLFYDKNNSHVVGEGSKIQKITFNLHGQSILISHYMRMHNLQGSDIAGPRISRSQIVKQPTETAVTYRDIIRESLEKSKMMGDELKKIKEQNSLEIKKLEKERNLINNEIIRLKRTSSADKSRKSSADKSRKSSAERPELNPILMSVVDLTEKD